MSDATAAVHAVPGLAPALPMRPREKLRDRGPAALTDAELLALLLGSGTAGRSAMRIARSVARRHPSELAGWPTSRWGRVQGIGPARAAALVAAFELGRRAQELPTAGSPIRGPDDVLRHVRDLRRGRRAHLVLLLLYPRRQPHC